MTIFQPQTGKEATASRLQALSKLKCAAGLAELANKKYKAAAKQFLQVNFDHLEYPEVSGCCEWKEDTTRGVPFLVDFGQQRGHLWKFVRFGLVRQARIAEIGYRKYVSDLSIFGGSGEGQRIWNRV